MSDINIPEMRRLAEAGTPGPWQHDGDQRPVVDPAWIHGADEAIAVVWASRRDGPDEPLHRLPRDANAAFIVAAVNNLTPLLDRLEAAEKALRDIKDVQCPRGLQGGDITAARALEDIHDIAFYYFERFAP